MFETFEDGEQARASLMSILTESDMLAIVIACEDDAAKIAKITIEDVLLAYHSNLWDDQHDGGPHKDDLLEINRLWVWFSQADLCDDFDQWNALPADELYETDPDSWWSANAEAETAWHHVEPTP